MELNNIGNNKSSIYLVIPFKKLCLATVALPLVSLVICFVTAYIFQQDDIHETHCRVCIIKNKFLLRKNFIFQSYFKYLIKLITQLKLIFSSSSRFDFLHKLLKKKLHNHFIIKIYFFHCTIFFCFSFLIKVIIFS